MNTYASNYSANPALKEFKNGAKIDFATCYLRLEILLLYYWFAEKEKRNNLALININCRAQS